MKSLRYVLAVAMLAVGFASPAHANHHDMQITEVFLGTGGSATAAFVELTTLSSGQNVVTNTEVVIYNAGGTEVSNAVFASNPSDASGSQGKILVGTPSAATLFDMTPDASLDEVAMPMGGGKACFESPTFNFVDCVAWGAYTGSSTGAGSPINPSEGIPLGASIHRKKTRGNVNIFDGADDTGESNKDFALQSPSPEGAGTIDEPQRIGFSDPVFERDETDGATSIDFDRDGGTGGIKVVSFSTINGTATAPSDFTAVTDESVGFGESENTASADLMIQDDSEFEGAEKAKLRVRNPTAGAVLSNQMNATLVIVDGEDDIFPPESTITRPKQGNTYERSTMTEIKGTFNDGKGEVEQVQVALRRKMTNGTCQWLKPKGFAGDSCLQASSFMQAEMHVSGSGKFVLPIDLLKRSKGTNVKNYTAYSFAVDWQGNVQDEIETGKNKNTFEIS